MNTKNISSVPGFKCQGMHVGLKSRSLRKDLAIIVSEKPAKVSAVYTRNLVIAECLKLNKLHTANGVAQAIICNSGNANACTGTQGYEGAKSMAKAVSKEFGILDEDVIVASTGIIGREFPTDKVVEGIGKICKIIDNNVEAGKNAAEAIMTTDTVAKEFYAEFEIQGKQIILAGIAKGSGMIHPDMGTMLAFAVSNINIEKKILDQLFRKAINDSYNMITVDGDTSTNDMAVIMCNGLAENIEITDINSPEAIVFGSKLKELCIDLAKKIVMDGEGITKFIEYKIINASNEDGARQIIRTVSDSSLVKTAMFGKDPNWGRIIAAAGRAGVQFNPEKIDLFIGEYQLLKDGQPTHQHLTEVEALLQEFEIYVTIDLKNGNASATGWGSDLTLEYVRFNSAYTT